MAASTRFLSAVALAFVAGVASTSAYMSRGDAQRDAPGASHEVAPSLAERLRAEAHGQSLPWSEPVKAKPARSKLTFTPGPADAPAEEGGAVADEGRASGPQVAPVPTPLRSPDDGGRSRVRLAQSDGQNPPPEDQAGPVPAIKRARPPTEDVGPSRARMDEAPKLARTYRDDGAGSHSKLAPSSRPSSQRGEEAEHPRALSAETQRHVPPPVEERARISVVEAPQRTRASDSLRRIRLAQEEDRLHTRTAVAPQRLRPQDAERPRTRVAEATQRLRATDPAPDEYSRARAAEAQRPVHRSRPKPSQNLPSLAAADDIRAAVRRAETRRERVSVASPYRTADLKERDDTSRAREVRVVRRDDALDDEPRVRVRRSVAASDGLMSWLSGPGGRF